MGRRRGLDPVVGGDRNLDPAAAHAGRCPRGATTSAARRRGEEGCGGDVAVWRGKGRTSGRWREVGRGRGGRWAVGVFGVVGWSQEEEGGRWGLRGGGLTG